MCDKKSLETTLAKWGDAVAFSPTRNGVVRSATSPATVATIALHSTAMLPAYAFGADWNEQCVAHQRAPLLIALLLEEITNMEQSSCQPERLELACMVKSRLRLSG